MIHRFAVTEGDKDHEVTVELLEGGSYRVSVDGRVRVIDARRVEAGTWSLMSPEGGRARLLDVDVKGSDYTVNAEGQTVALKLVEGRAAKLDSVLTKRVATGPQLLRAPMPGKVVKVLVKAGDAVKAGQAVAVIEAMKMENELRAARDGTVGEVKAAEGQTVEAGQVLATIA